MNHNKKMDIPYFKDGKYSVMLKGKYHGVFDIFC